MSKITLQHLIDFYLRIDLRSLALFRILAALLLIHDWWVRLPDLGAFYTASGVLPVDALPKAGGIYHFSLLDNCQTLTSVQIAFAIGLFFYLLLLVGYQTRIAKFASFVFFASVLSRSLVLHASSHLVLIVMLMWSLFLPLGRRFSLDQYFAERRRKKNTDAQDVSTGFLTSSLCDPSLAALAMVGQIAAIYLFTAIVKYGTAWQDLTALYYALQIDQMVTPLGRWLSTAPLWSIKLATASTLALEWMSAFLIFSFWWQPYLRRVAIGSLVVLHVGIWLTINVGDFSPIMISTYALLLLPQDWLWLSKFFPALGVLPAQEEIIEVKKSFVQTLLLVLTNAAVVLIAAAILLDAYNINVAGRLKQPKLVAPPLLKAISKAAFLKQDWHLFAPDVLRDDGWMVVDGITAAGEHIDPLTGKEPTLAKPVDLQSRIPSILWRKYFYRLQKPVFIAYRPYLCRYLIEQSRLKYRESPQDQIVALSLIYCREVTQAPGVEQPFAVVPVVLWQASFNDPDSLVYDGKTRRQSAKDSRPEIVDDQVNSD